jgi:hypothetical protein
MYIRDRDQLLQAGAAYAGLGQTAPAALKCIPTPKWLSLFQHWVVQKLRLPLKLFPVQFGWVASGVVQLAPGRLNPGTTDATTHTLNLDTNLDPKLKALMGKLVAGQAPFDQDPFKYFMNKRGKIRVALVDLSSRTKLLFPKVAEFDSATITYAASLAKIGALYAAHQLKFDLNTKAKNSPTSFTKTQLSKLKSIFNITLVGTPPAPVFAFNDDLLKALDSICESSSANKIMRAVGFRYIASALWQADLYDCWRGGLWLGGLYDGCKTLWHRDPIGGQCHAVNALSVANYFTLLAQGRLIDDLSSQAIMQHLVKQRAFCRSFFEEGLQDSGRFNTGDHVFSKIGIYGTYYHEGALIERVSIDKKYAVAVLTESGDGTGYKILPALIPFLDELVKTNP